ncbi:PAS domain-containing protein [Pseudooceanicola sp. C21-150M6]|uniref:PAS domain-containing protein n=1 Tax=Pseudooceanicola sp. C21-150M6 TaxID=3434355 RepID=UPI003D7FED1B
MAQDKSGSGTVVEMTQFASHAHYQPLREVEAYWTALRAGRLVPRRSDVDPRGMENALQYAFVLERIATGMGRLRIAGTHLTDLLGMEVRGMPFSAFFTPEARGDIADVLEAAFSDPARVTVDVVAETALGKPGLEGRLILLPLKSDLGDISRVLGCFVTRGTIGRAPRRFGITNVSVSPLLGDAHIPDDGAEDADIAGRSAPKARKPETAPSGGFAETGAPFAGEAGRGSEPSARRATRRHYLRLVHDAES